MFKNNSYSDNNELTSCSSIMGRISTQSLTSTAFEPSYIVDDEANKKKFTSVNNSSNGNGDTINNDNDSNSCTEFKKLSFLFLSKKARTIIQRQIVCNDNRYALQMGVAFLIATLFVVVEPITKFAPNAFWVGVSVVTVLDNSVGGFLALSIQRMIGTFIGGGLSIFVMTLSRVIFPIWSPGATVFFCFLMFCQVFAIARIKLRPNMNYAGGIGLLTTVIILLSGYPNLIHDKISGSAELGFWRVFDLIIGIFIAMWVSLCIFPLKARNAMRKNLGESLEEAADLYERAAIYCLDLTNLDGATKLPVKLDIEHTKKETGVSGESANHNNNRYNDDTNDDAYKYKQNDTNKEVKQKNMTTIGLMTDTCSDNNKTPEVQQSSLRQTAIQIEEPLQRTSLATTTLNQDMEIWNHELINELCDKAFHVLSRLQTESTRLRSVNKEYYLQVSFHYIFSGGRRESDSIDAMKRIVWALVSFRLLLPLIRLDNGKEEEFVYKHSSMKFNNNTGTDNTSTATAATTIHDRVTPTKALLENFEDSLWVMRKLATMLKDTKKKLSDEPDWPILQWHVMNGTSLVQQELLDTINIIRSSDHVDGLKLLSYYGFLVRCSTIWQGLESIVNKLGPQRQKRQSSVSTFSHVSYPPSSQGILHAQE
ncbi:aluminum activated malate transporter-domain-containing protein [Circinella umbellata]|nr:aluminum activated malate transporter-domain-containing protein [Circinella umbellata]